MTTEYKIQKQKIKDENLYKLLKLGIQTKKTSMWQNHTSGPYVSAITTGSKIHSFSFGHLQLDNR